MNGTMTDRLNDRMDSDNGFAGHASEDTPLAILNRTEIDQQIATAKRYPRSISRAKQRMIEMATLDEETAQGCIYTLKRWDKDSGEVFINGPSVRLAEIAVHCWGNIRAGARVIGEEGNFIVAQGVCHDLESNTFTSIEVRRRIVGKSGNRFKDDMIGVTANAACAIAFRNAVYKIVPKVYINPAYEAARKVISGNDRTIGERRQALVSYFSKLHVTSAQLMAFLEKPDHGIDDINGDDLATLHGVATAIRDGDTTIDEQFPAVGIKLKENGGASAAAEMNAKLDAAKKQKQSPSDRAPSAGAEAAPDSQAIEHGDEGDHGRRPGALFLPCD